MTQQSYPISQNAAKRGRMDRPGRLARKLLVCLGVLLSAAYAALHQYEQNPELWQQAWDRFLLPFRLAKLQTEPLDEALPMPVQGATLRNVRDSWHAARPGGRRHEGQDIFARRGTPVVSATRGFVIRAGRNELGGNVVSIIGPGGRTYYYAHLDRFAELLRVGQQVEPGSLIGYVGNTGNARGSPPHLHFGVYGHTGAVNPYPLLVAGVQKQQPEPATD